jgi:hypothetical protein
MKNGICPKCGSKDVRSGTQWSRGGTYSSNRIPLGNMVSGAPLDNYVCVNCGYVESYISDERSLREIARYWPRVIEHKLKPDQKATQIRPYKKRKRLGPLSEDMFENGDDA